METPLAETSASPSLPLSTSGVIPAPQCLTAGKHLTLILRPALPDRDLGRPSHWREVRCPDGPDLGYDRMDVRIEHRSQHIRDRRGGPGTAAGDSIEPYGQRGTHLRGGQRPPDPAAVRHDKKHLLAADLFLAQASVLAVADLCSHAVHGLVARQCAVHDRSAGRDLRPYAVRQLYPGTGDDGEQLLESERLLGDRHGTHGTSLNQRY